LYHQVGYIFSEQLELALGHIQRLGSGLVILVGGLFALWILWKFVQRRRFLKQIQVARIAPEELRDRMASPQKGTEPTTAIMRIEKCLSMTR
jgi:hypothetical protein